MTPPQSTGERFRSRRTANFTESTIREMSRLAYRHRAINLAQGFPDFPAPEEIRRAAGSLTLVLAAHECAIM